MNIFNWDNFKQNVCNWIYKDSSNEQQMRDRAMIVATSPVIIGFVIGTILILMIETGDGL